MSHQFDRYEAMRELLRSIALTQSVWSYNVPQVIHGIAVMLRDEGAEVEAWEIRQRHFEVCQRIERLIPRLVDGLNALRVMPETPTDGGAS